MMVKKVNPVSFRVSKFKNWKSCWFVTEKKLFRRYVLEDTIIFKVLYDFLMGKSIYDILIRRELGRIEIIIYTNAVSKIVGKKGFFVNKIKTLVDKLTIDRVFVFIKEPNEVKKFFTAFYLCSILNSALSTSLNNKYKKIIYSFGNRNYPFISGLKVVLKGRLEGISQSRRKVFKYGLLNLSCFDQYIDYFSYSAITASGKIGIKVWVCFEKQITKEQFYN